MIDRIGQIAIPVQDLDRALAFYRDVVGLRFLFRVPNLAFFDCGGVRIMLSPPEGGAAPHSSVLYFNVSYIQAEFSEIVSRGAKPEGEPHLIARLADREVWMGHFWDSEENLMALMSEIPLRA